MSRRLNYRRLLLAAVDGYVDATPDSRDRADDLIEQCRRSLRPFTLDDYAWGGFAAELSDTVYSTSHDYLSETRATLRDPRSTIRRVYVNYDFRPHARHLGWLSANEFEWYRALRDLIDWLIGFPFPDPDVAGEEYDRQTRLIMTLAARSPVPRNPGDETIYHVVLREATALMTSLDVAHAQRYVGHLIPSPPYTEVSEVRHQHDPWPIDGSIDVAWADKALRAVAGEGWLLATCRFNISGYQFSLH